MPRPAAGWPPDGEPVCRRWRRARRIRLGCGGLGRTAGLVSLDCLAVGGCFLELGRVDALDAAEAGLKGAHINDLLGGDPPANAKILRGILSGEIQDAKTIIGLILAAPRVGSPLLEIEYPAV